MRLTKVNMNLEINKRNEPMAGINDSVFYTTMIYCTSSWIIYGGGGVCACVFVCVRWVWFLPIGAILKSNEADKKLEGIHTPS